MRRDNVFPSKFLKASDLQGRSFSLVIDHVELDEVGPEKEQKAIMYFRGAEKGLVLNGTNWDTLEQLTGDPESDHWQGISVTLYPDTTSYQGKRVPCLRVRGTNPATLGADGSEVPDMRLPATPPPPAAEPALPEKSPPFDPGWQPGGPPRPGADPNGGVHRRTSEEPEQQQWQPDEGEQRVDDGEIPF